jgi:hypothetical protein
MGLIFRSFWRVCMQNHSPLGFFWLWFCVVALLISSPKKHEQYGMSWNNHEKKKWALLEEGLGWTVDSLRCTRTVLSPYLTSLLLVLSQVRALLGRICLSWPVLWRIKGTPWEVPSNNGWINSKCCFGLQIQLQGSLNHCHPGVPIYCECKTRCVSWTFTLKSL